MKKTGILLMAAMGLLFLASCGRSNETAATETAAETPTTTQTITTTAITTTETRDNTAFRNKLSTLGKNVNHLPSGAEVFQYDTEKTVLTSYDYTTPGDYYYSDRTEYYYQYQSTWNRVDSFRSECLSVRDEVLANVKQLDTFVKFLNNHKGMLHYDSVADEIKISCVSDWAYYDITSGYTKDGKIKLTAVRYNWYQMEDDTTKQSIAYEILEYVEGEKCIYLNTDDCYQYWNGYGFGRSKIDLLINSDPVSHEIVQILHYSEDYGDYHRDNVETSLQENVEGIRAVVNYIQENDQYDVRAYDEDGHLLMKYSAARSRSIDIPLYSLDGWSSITAEETDNDSLDVAIGDETYSEEGRYYGDYYIRFYKNNLLGNDDIPLVSISDPKIRDLNYDRAMEILNEDFGLTPKRNLTEELGTILSDYSGYAKGKTIFGITDVTTIDPALFKSIYDRYDIHTLDFAGVKDKMNVTAISADSQEETYFDTGYLAAEASGDAEYDTENLTVNLKNIRVTIPASALLSDTADYQAALLLCGNDTKMVALGKITHFDRVNDLVLEFDDADVSVIAEDWATGEGDYVLELAVCMTSDENLYRVSDSILFRFPDTAFSGTYALPDTVTVYTDEATGTVTEVTTSKELSFSSADGELVFHVEITGVETKVISASATEN